MDRLQDHPLFWVVTGLQPGLSLWLALKPRVRLAKESIVLPDATTVERPIFEDGVRNIRGQPVRRGANATVASGVAGSKRRPGSYAELRGIPEPAGWRGSTASAVTAVAKPQAKPKARARSRSFLQRTQVEVAMAERAECTVVSTEEAHRRQSRRLVTLHVLAHSPDSEALIAESGRASGGRRHRRPDSDRRDDDAASQARARGQLRRRLRQHRHKYAAGHGITVTNTPDVLTEEVADTALGLLLCTVRSSHRPIGSCAPGSGCSSSTAHKATLRDRTVGIVGLGRIGKAIARRLDAFLVPVVYHTRRPQPDVPYRHYPSLVDMARDVDTLILITPGGPATRNLVGAEVLDARGPDGIVINRARGTVVDDAALMR